MKTIRIALLLIPALIFGAAVSAKADGPADSLTFIGHASVKIVTAGGQTIYIDPFAGTAADYADSADVLLVTHLHGDHNAVNLVKKKAGCLTVSSTQALQAGVYRSFTAGDIRVDAVPAYNSNHPKNACVGYVVEFNGIRIYHAGDTGKIAEMADLAARDIAYALLPIDGIYNMTPEAAVEAVGLIRPKYAIPIHSMPPPDTGNAATIARFTSPNRLVLRNGETIALEAGTSGVGDAAPDASGRPARFSLLRNYPNPFNPGTTVEFSVPMSGRALLEVFDMTGRRVAALVEADLEEGEYSVPFDGERLAGGIYVARLRQGAVQAAARMILAK
ncbi:MAG: MBL fold metallo-hydrolase [bacterium]|nr:MBL fold metallo-hydrolase [bacterium]